MLGARAMLVYSFNEDENARVSVERVRVSLAAWGVNATLLFK